MTDERLRHLERRARETGAVDDEAEYLLARVRVGDLDHDRLALAAYCGHEGARLALGDSAPARATGLREWVGGLEWWGPEVALRGFAEACEAALAGGATRGGYAERQLLQVAEQVRSGTFPAAAEAVFPHSAQAKVLVLAVFRQRARPRYLDAGDPEIVRARGEVWQRIRRAGELSYNHSDRERGAWIHWFVHVAPGGEEQTAGSFRRLPGRRGLFDVFSGTG